MVFRIEKPTRAYRGENETYYDYEEVTYEATKNEVLDALAEIIVDECNKERLSRDEYLLAVAITKKIIEETETQEDLADKYYEELKEYFSEVA